MSEFTGRYFHTLDLKGRLKFPSFFREGLNEEKRVYLSYGVSQCLTVYPASVWRAQVDRLKTITETDGEAFDYRRTKFASAQECELDSQGRLLIPAHIRSLAGIARSIAVIGNLDVVEVWDRARWEEYFKQSLEQHHENARKVPPLKASQQQEGK